MTNGLRTHLMRLNQRQKTELKFVEHAAQSVISHSTL